jgi:hypothetical protein
MLGGNVAAIALVAMGLAGLWLLNALWLGRREAALAQIAAAPADGE